MSVLNIIAACGDRLLWDLRQGTIMMNMSRYYISQDALCAAYKIWFSRWVLVSLLCCQNIMNEIFICLKPTELPPKCFIMPYSYREKVRTPTWHIIKISLWPRFRRIAYFERWTSCHLEPTNIMSHFFLLDQNQYNTDETKRDSHQFLLSFDSL